MYCWHFNGSLALETSNNEADHKVNNPKRSISTQQEGIPKILVKTITQTRVDCSLKKVNGSAFKPRLIVTCLLRCSQ